jgi:hypothetical protein
VGGAGSGGDTRSGRGAPRRGGRLSLMSLNPRLRLGASPGGGDWGRGPSGSQCVPHRDGADIDGNGHDRTVSNLRQISWESD